ncbi:MAG: hypothetical protein PF484_13045 [Bacteroidales bacterium]|jgi:hypothetical protein|nr:hypothetical protein [Bacteroidales bacterium]
MKTQSILTVAAIILKIAMVTTIIVGTLVTISLIHSSYSPAYNNVTIHEKGIGINFTNKLAQTVPPQTYAEYVASGDKAIYLSKLTFATKFRIWIQIMCILSIYILIIKELISFIRNIKSYSSFFINCSKTFRRLKMFLVSLLLVSIAVSLIKFKYTMQFSGSEVIRISDHTSGIYLNSSFYLLISIFVLTILGSAFKEGERMRNENKFTI